MTKRTTFQKEVERHLRRTRMAPSTFGRIAVNDPNFVKDLRADRNFSIAIIERVSRFIAKPKKKGLKNGTGKIKN